MSKPQLITVPDNAPKTAGAIAYWRLSGDLDLSHLREAWEARGLDPKLLPEEPSPAVALRRALAVLKKADTRIEKTRAGFALFDRAEKGHDGDVEFTKRLVCNVDQVGRAKVSFALHESDRASLLAMFEEASCSLAGADVSPWLASLMRGLFAVPLRDTGGVYFVPAFSLPTFGLMLGALHASTRHVIHAIPALDSKEAVRAVLEALDAEATSEADAMRAEVESEDLGTRALQTRIARVSSIEAKLSSYESLLGAKLDELRDRITNTRAGLTVAMTIAESKEKAQ